MLNGKFLIWEPPSIPFPATKFLPLPMTPVAAVEPTFSGEIVPTSSLSASSMCMTVTNPLSALNTAAPLLSLAASAFPQCSFISCCALPLISGILTHTLAVPLAASHFSI